MQINFGSITKALKFGQNKNTANPATTFGASLRETSVKGLNSNDVMEYGKTRVLTVNADTGSMVEGE